MAAEKRIRVLEEEVAMLRDCLERGVAVANHSHAQSVVELRMLKREKDTLKEQLQHTATELSGDVYLAFSEVKRLSASNVDLLESLDNKYEEVTDLKHKLQALNDVYLATTRQLKDAERRCRNARQESVDHQVLIASLRRTIASQHERKWAEDERSAARMQQVAVTGGGKSAAAAHEDGATAVDAAAAGAAAAATASELPIVTVAGGGRAESAASGVQRCSASSLSVGRSKELSFLIPPAKQDLGPLRNTATHGIFDGAKARVATAAAAGGGDGRGGSGAVSVRAAAKAAKCLPKGMDRYGKQRARALTDASPQRTSVH